MKSLLEQLGKFQDMPMSLPPLADWNPELSGVMDMTIKANGDWLHEGEVIHRERLVRLFSTILRKEEDGYFLVTPVEKWQIQVEAHPFIISLAQTTKIEHGSQVIRVVTNVGDEFEIGANHRLVSHEGSVPYIEVRDGLTAILGRNVYYQLVESAYERSDGSYCIDSNGESYVIG